MSSIQSERPEDTAAAREQGLSAEDFEPKTEVHAPARRCLTADEILSAEDSNHLDNWVPTPEWGGPGSGVYVLTPTGEDREQFEKAQKVRRVRKGRKVEERREMNFDELHERLMVEFACDKKGRRIFECGGSKERRKEVVCKLKKKAAAPIGRISAMAGQLMGWTDQDWADLVGNSETDPS
jgi:hypothetical protein